MTKSEAKKRIHKLKKVINHHRYLYHVLDRQEISDAALDSLKNELARLEREYPEFLTPDSPTQRVGGEALEKFEKAEHAFPMLSIDDVFSKEEIEDWAAYVKRLAPNEEFSYFCEMKIDGFAVSLIYKKGQLVRAATRGNGKVGEDVTRNIKTVESIPLAIELHGDVPARAIRKNLSGKLQEGEVEVRGEVYMDKKTFTKVNREQKRKGKQEYANPRNLAAGSVRQLDPTCTASRGLSFIAYDLAGEFGQDKHSEEHDTARALGFRTDPYAALCKNTKEVFEFWQKISGKREKLPYHIDGLVVTIDNNALFEKLGVAGKSPRGMRAWKFAPEQATTVVEEIRVHVGRQGAVTPVAHLTPVQIGGATISRATLHNQDEIERLDVRIGDTVIVGRAGDVIPDVMEVVKDLRTGKEKIFFMPRYCPACGNRLKRTEEVVLRCVNSACSARTREYLYFFVSKKAFDIAGLGPKIIDRLVEEGLVSSAPDIFDLTEGDLTPLERFGEKSAGNIVGAIQKSKKISLARFLFALGIRHAGEETAQDLAQYFGTLENVAKADKEELENIPDVGGVVAEEIHAWFQQKANRDFLKEFLGKGIVIERGERVGSKLKKHSFVFTGILERITRQEAEQKVRMLGGDTSGSVSSKTDYVVVGENPGSKYDKAKELGVKIIGEKEFLEMIG